MRDFGLAFSISGPVCLIIAFCALAMIWGTSPLVIAKAVAVIVPLLGYVAFSVFTVFWFIKIGDVGLHQNMTYQSRFYFYHGMAVILSVVLAAAGSFIVLFARELGGMTGGTF